MLMLYDEDGKFAKEEEDRLRKWKQREDRYHEVAREMQKHID